MSGPEADLSARFGDRAPFVEVEPALPFRVYEGRGAVALVGTPARVRAWLDGWRVAEGSPFRPVVLEETEGAVLLEPIGELVDPRAALLALPRGEARARGTRRAVLASLDAEVSLPRALGRLGVPRRKVDRYLDAEVDELVETLAVGFGGCEPGGWRRADKGIVALRMDRARPDGWLALELAALGDDGDDEVSSLARLAVALRRAALLGDTEDAARLAASLVGGSPEPSRVRVWIEGPDVARGLWEADGAEVDARRARWLLQHVDGVAVAGDRIRVRVEPPVRAGRRPPRREPRAERQRRLFSRWDEGVEVDDEGLVGLTPERLALAIAARVSGVVIDGTCGVGGLTIALARTAGVSRVVAVDRSAERLAMARHNAAIYGVEDRIELVHGDAAAVVRERAADALVLDPPWGGREYDRERVALGDLGMDVAATVEAFEGRVLLKLPRSFDPTTLPAGAWTLELLLDDREIAKLLLAERAPIRDRAP
ncbi:MAG: methyltransferase [Sandaracinaceae bacterium]|nr:methyltransferase [Sandaracinaceae bacterium]